MNDDTTKKMFSVSERTKGLIFVSMIAVFMVTAGVGGAIWAATSTRPSSPPIVLSVATPASALPTHPFPEPRITAQAAIVYDLAQQKVLFEKRSHVPLPLASLTKLMTAVVASETLSSTSPVRVAETDAATEGSGGIHPNETWNFRELLGFTLLMSSNGGARAIASAAGAKLDPSRERDSREVFVDRMNAKARELGMTQTLFGNETGLDLNSELGGAYGSARDVATLLAYVASTSPYVIEETADLTSTFYTQDRRSYSAHNTNQDVSSIPGLIASKTGFTDLAGGNLAVIFDLGFGHPIEVVVLGSTKEGRFTDARTLADATIAYFVNTD